MEQTNKTLIVIAGPTAVGKTDLAVALAKKMKTEIISADSRQIFRELNIGTAKPSATALQEVKHHFINSHSISEEYDAAQFATDALGVINKLFEQKNVCILCGGSGLYIKAVCEGFDDVPEVPGQIRDQLNALYESHGITALQEKMLEEDPDYFAKIDKQNPHRLIRALEIKIGTGRSLSSYFKGKTNVRDFNIIKIGLTLERDILYDRINTRMDQMIEAGLFEEAKSVYQFRHHQALQTVGYSEIFGFMEGKYDRDETVRLLKRNSRRYAKRQLTWFMKDKAFTWFDPRSQEDIFVFIEKRLKEKLTND